MLSEKSRKRLMSAYDRMAGKKTKDMSEIDALTKEFKENEPDAFHVDITRGGQKIGTLDGRVFFDRPVGFLFGNPGFIGSTETRVGIVNLDDLRKLREEALSSGTGSGRWIRCAQVLMDSLPAYYATAQAMNERQQAAGVELGRMKAVVDAAQEWSSERTVRDWGDAELLKALWTFDGDRTEPCEGCDGQCDEPCAPCTVVEGHAGVDRQTTALVKAGKLFDSTTLDSICAEADSLGCRLPGSADPNGYSITLALVPHGTTAAL